MPTKQFRKVCFTHHDVDNPPTLGTMSYLAYAMETCPTTGKKHLQGWAYSETKWSFKKWKEALPTAHIEEMKGTFTQNDVYCSKEGELEEFGQRPMDNGVKRTMAEFKERLDEGDIPEEIAEEDVKKFTTWTQNYRAFDRYAHHVRGKRTRKDRHRPKVYIRIGDAGSGKTRWLDDTFGLTGWARMPNPTGNWFITPAVSNSDTVLIDDVGPKKVPKVEEFLEWTDRYPVEFNCKGGHLWWKPKNIVFTSNCSWTEWWPDLSDAHRAAIERRIFCVSLVYKDKPEEHFYTDNSEDA